MWRPHDELDERYVRHQSGQRSESFVELLRSCNSLGVVTERKQEVACPIHGRRVTKVSFWLGNSTAVTNLELGDASRMRLVLRAGRRLLRAAARPVRRTVRRRPPHLRYAIVQSAGALGMVAGAVGIRTKHH